MKKVEANKAKTKKAITEAQSAKTRATYDGYGSCCLSYSVIMLDQKPWTRTEEFQKANARKYHARVEQLTAADLQTFIDAKLNPYSGDDEGLIKLIEQFMECRLPYDSKVLGARLVELAAEDYEVYIHMAMCCLGSVAGKTDDGVDIGVDCSYFGRFHGRLEEHFFKCML
jgi:hypothetical protein